MDGIFLILGIMGSRNKFLQKFGTIFLIDIIFFVLFSLIGYFGFKTILERMNLLNKMGPQLYSLLGQIQGQTLETLNITGLTEQVSSVEAQVHSLQLLMFIVPLFLFILYILFQSVSWDLAGRKETKFKEILDLKYLWPFLGITLIYFVILGVLWSVLFSTLDLGTYIIILMLISFIFKYFLFVNYAYIHKERNFWKAFRRSFYLGFNKVASLFLIYLLVTIISVALIGAFRFLSISGGGLIILGVLLILMFDFIKIYFSYKIEN